MYQTLVIIKKLNNPNNPYIQYLADEVRAIAHSYGIDVITDEPDRETSETLYVAIGGDGTFLFAARRAVRSGGAIVGINTGNLGFLTEFDPKTISDTVNNTITRAFDDENMFIEERTILKTYINGEYHYGFNEFVISSEYSDSAIHYALAVEGVRKSSVGEHKANGVIVSTPTGSTAYSLNVGGAIIEPDLDVIQILPVAAMSMTTRPLIISANKSVLVTVKPNHGCKVSIKADGQEIAKLGMESEITVKIERVKLPVKIIHDINWNFFDVLKHKLGWNKTFT